MPAETFKLIADNSQFDTAMRDSASKAEDSTGRIALALAKTAEGGYKGAEGVKALNDSVKMTRGEIREANGTIALLGDTIGLHIPRHCRTLISELSFVGPALNAAFSAVAIVTIAKALYEAGEKAAEFFKKMEEAKEKNERASNELSMQLQKTNLDLAVGNDKIEKQIGLLEKKPVNGLKLALDEARLSAMNLASELDATIQKERELLQASNPGWFKQFMGSDNTDSAVADLGGYQNRMKGANSEFDSKGRAATGVAQEEQVEIERKAKLTAITVDYYNQIAREIEEREELVKIVAENNRTGQSTNESRLNQLTSKYQGGDQTASIEALKREQANIGVIATQMQLEAHRTEIEQTQEADEAAKVKAELAKQAGQAASRAQMEGFEEGLQTLKKAHVVSIQEEFNYWSDMQAKTAEGSDNWRRINTKIAEEAQQSARQSHEKIFAYEKLQRAMESQSAPSTEGIDKYIKEQDEDFAQVGKRWEAYHQAVAKGSEMQDQLNRELHLTTINIDELNGLISKHDATLASAAVRAGAYAAKLVDLRAELGRVLADGNLSAEDKATKKQLLNNEITQTEGEAKIDAMKSDQAASSQTIGGAFGHNLQQTAQQFTNTPEQIRQANTQFLTGMNANISALLTGQKTNWQQFLKQMANTLASDALKQGEGLLFANLPHFADGGYSGSDPIMVGEKGPEIFNPGSGGYVTANHKMGGSGGGNTYHIDARGTDPVLTHAAVARAMKQTHAQSVHDAGKAMQERSRRTPK